MVRAPRLPSQSGVRGSGRPSVGRARLQRMSLPRHRATAAALKLGSLSPRLYRWLGNTLGQRRRARAGMPHAHGDRALEFLGWCRKHRLVRDGDRLLELGTGWVHFDSILLRMFHDVRITLFDVWDNRQLDALRRYTADLERRLLRDAPLAAAGRDRVRGTAAIVARAGSFEELYGELGFDYVIDPRGVLDRLPGDAFDFVYSNNVLEHVQRETVPLLVDGVSRVLKPGGSSWHNIDLSDHLVSFGRIRDLSPKHYLRYTETTWRRWYENTVQYINRLQLPEWLEIFERAGLETVDREVQACPIDALPVAERYRPFDAMDLACTRLIVAHRKRGGEAGAA